MAFIAERLIRIREILLEKKTVDISTLCKRLEVSDVTIRKDLDRLEQENFLKKIHGGAVLSDSVDERYFQPKNKFPFYEQKQRIAAEAVGLINDFDNIFIGPGSSCYLFSKMLFGHTNVRVVTNNIRALGVLYNSVKRVNVIGGDIGHRDEVMFSSGLPGYTELDGVYLNKAVVTFNGVSVEGGFTLDEIVLVNLYKKVFSISKEVIVLASENKIGHHSMYRSAGLDQCDCFITTANLPENLKQGFSDAQVRVIEV